MTNRMSSNLIAWVVESSQYTSALRVALNGSDVWQLEWCGANGSLCANHSTANVTAVVGMADAVDLLALPSLRLVQSASFYYTTLAAVPACASVARYNPGYLSIGKAVIAEWMIAAALQRLYHLQARSNTFRQCAFASDSPYSCPAASDATRHKTFASLTVGVLGYGNIGRVVASMAAGLGATVVATKLHGPFHPPPSPLKWLSADNDRLFRAADVVFVTVAGTAGQLINRTSLALLRDGAHLIPAAHETVDWGALADELERRPSLFATVDNWPHGCWDWPSASCGDAGAPSWPASRRFAELANVMPLGDMSMRDEVFWASSASSVAQNLVALSEGRPLAYLVRNGSDACADARAS